MHREPCSKLSRLNAFPQIGRMPSLRKPWPVSRRDTDGITLNTIEGKEAAATATPAEVDDHAKAAAAEKDLQTFSDLHRYYITVTGNRSQD